MYTYIYIYRERERDICKYKHIYMYICIYTYIHIFALNRGSRRPSLHSARLSRGDQRWSCVLQRWQRQESLQNMKHSLVSSTLNYNSATCCKLSFWNILRIGVVIVIIIMIRTSCIVIVIVIVIVIMIVIIVVIVISRGDRRWNILLSLPFTVVIIIITITSRQYHVLFVCAV